MEEKQGRILHDGGWQSKCIDAVYDDVEDGDILDLNYIDM